MMLWVSERDKEELGRIYASLVGDGALDLPGDIFADKIGFRVYTEWCADPTPNKIFVGR